VRRAGDFKSLITELSGLLAVSDAPFAESGGVLVISNA